MNKRLIKTSAAILMAALMTASSAPALTVAAAEVNTATSSASSSTPYIKSFTVSKSRVGLGLGVSFKSEEVNASMHYGQYSKYQITITKDGKLVKTIDDVHCQPENLWFYPEEAGTYKATLNVSDFYGKKLSPKSVTFVAYAAGDKISNFYVTSSSSIKRVNSPLTFSADIDAKLYYDSYRFCYIRIYKNGNEVAKLNFNRTPNKQSKWTPTEAGDYTAKLSVADWYDKSAEATISFTVVESCIESFSASNQYNAFINEPIQFYSTEKNCGMHYGQYARYEIVVKKDGKVVKTINDVHKESKNLVFTPTTAGKYTATLNVTDFYGFQVPSKSIDISVVEPVIKSLTVTKASPVVGETAKFKAVTENARSYHGMYSSYQLEIKKDGTRVALLSDKYGSTLSWIPTSAGKYTATLKMVDFYGYKLKDKTISFNVVKPLTATAKLSASKIKLGNTVTINASAANAVGTKKYTYQYKKSGSTTWTTIKSNITGTSVTFKPASATSYEFRVTANDSNGSSKTSSTVKLTVTK